MIAPQETGGIVPVRRNGCHNRPPMTAGYWAQDGYIDTERTIRRPVWIQHRMTTDCQFSRLKTNENYPVCQTCIHRQEATI